MPVAYSQMRRAAALRVAVQTVVDARPGLTTREIASVLFGEPRYSFNKANRILRALEFRRNVRRDEGRPCRWYPTEAAL